MTTARSDFDRALERIGKGSHVSLTTFRRNGQGVPTPVGSLVHDGTLYALTPPDTGKAKRIRNNPQVTIAPCDMKGTVPDGVAAVPATARLLDPAETARVEEMMRRRFFMYRVVHLVDRALRRERPLVAIAVRAQPPLGRGVPRDFPDTRS